MKHYVEQTKKYFRQISQDKVVLVYLSLIVLSFIGSIIFQSLNKAPQIWDSASHINLSMLYAHKIQQFRFGEMLTLSGYYPPFVHIIGGIFFTLVPIINSPLILSFGFYAFALIYLYKLTKLFTQNDKMAIFAVLVFALFPQVYKELRLFQLDLPLTALIISSLYYLHSSLGLTKKYESKTFFLLASFAQLTKWYAFVFLIVPFLYEMFLNKEKIKLSIKDFYNNFFKGVGIFLVLNLIWYFANFQSILNFFQVYASFGELNDPQNPLSIEGISEYYKLISVYQLFYFNFVVAVLSLTYMLIKKTRIGLYFVLSIFVPYLIFTLIVNKDVRYVMPLTPYFAIGITYGIYFLVDKVSKKIPFIGIASLVIFLGINTFLYVFVSFNQMDMLTGPYKVITALVSGPVEKYQWTKWNPPEMAYNTGDWKMGEIYEFIKEKTDYNADVTRILFAIDYPYFNKIEFDTLQIYERNSYKVDLTAFDQEISSLGQYDFILTSFNPSPKSLRNHEKMFEINRYLAGAENVTFEQQGFFGLPNGEDVYIFKNRGGKFFPTLGDTQHSTNSEVADTDDELETNDLETDESQSEIVEIEDPTLVESTTTQEE